MAKQIVVTSASTMPRLRAGVSFYGAMAFPVEHFTADELKDIIGDRLLTVVVGEVLHADAVDAFLAANAEKPQKAAKA